MNRLFTKAGESGTPLGGTFELTARCCLDCRMCYIHRKENDLSACAKEKDTEWWLSLARQAKEKGTLILLLTGGEPLLRRDFDEIYTYCVKSGMMVTVNTNGVLLDDDKIRLFTEYPPERLNITLYGTSAETYSKLCGNGDVFEKVVSAVMKCVSAGINVKLNYSITPYNKDDALSAYDFAKKLGVPVQPVSYMFSPVRTSGETVRLDAAEAAKAQFEWQKHHLGDEDFCRYIVDFRDKRHTPQIDGDCGEKINCRAGLSTFWVTWDGKMTPCGMMNEPACEIADFDAAWKNIRAMRENINLPVKCGNCEHRNYCDVCAAVSKAETGEFSGIPEYACKKAEEYHRLCENFLINSENKNGGNLR